MATIVDIIKRIDAGLDFENFDQVKMYIQALRKRNDVKEGCAKAGYTTQTFRNALTRARMEDLKDGEREVIVSVVKVISARKKEEKLKATKATQQLNNYANTN